MKDKELRERLDYQAEDIRINRAMIFKLENRLPSERISIKECPKCEHDVLAVYKIVIGVVGMGQYGYQCLTCGSKFTCSEKCICELI